MDIELWGNTDLDMQSWKVIQILWSTREKKREKKQAGAELGQAQVSFKLATH